MVNIYQVYFDRSSEMNCSPKWHTYDNSLSLTEFFENSVIRHLIQRGEHKKGYFGVFSHDWKECISFKEEGLHPTPGAIDFIVEKHQCDVYGFCKRREQQNIALQAERYHPGITLMFEKILSHLGLKMPAKLGKIILFNLMIGNEKFWEGYTKDMLFPAMELLKNMPEAYGDSNYQNLGRKMTPEKAVRFKKAFGKEYYPYHPFILERLPSIYLQYHPELNFKQIF